MIKRSAKYICAISAVVGLVIATHGNEIRTSEKGLLLIGNAEGCMKKPYQPILLKKLTAIKFTAYKKLPSYT